MSSNRGDILHNNKGDRFSFKTNLEKVSILEGGFKFVWNILAFFTKVSAESGRVGSTELLNTPLNPSKSDKCILEEFVSEKDLVSQTTAPHHKYYHIAGMGKPFNRCDI